MIISNFAKMDKSLWILFFVIYCVNCESCKSCKTCNQDGDHDPPISPVDDRNIKVITLPDVSNNFLTGMVWDSRKQSSYAVDFISPPGVDSIYRYDYNAQRIYGATIPGEINPSFLWPVEGCDNEFVIGLNGALKLVRWDGVSPTATVIRTILNVYGHLNYFTTDREGRLYFGTLNSSTFCSTEADFAMYRYSNGSLTKIFKDLKFSMGLTIDFNRNKFYHSDPCRYQILEFDFDPKTGDICNGRVVFDFKNAGVTPYPTLTGIKVDAAGWLYAALYETGQMWVIDPKTSKVLNKINFPSPGASDVGFWGPNLDELYVLAARILVYPYGGGVYQNRTQDRVFFKVDGLNARGYDAPRVRLHYDYKCH